MILFIAFNAVTLMSAVAPKTRESGITTSQPGSAETHIQQSFGQSEAFTSTMEVFDRWVDLTYQRERIPGLAIGIVVNGELAWSRGYGVANLQTQEKVTPKTLFGIASLTKLFTMTATLRMWDAGKLSLDARVHDILPTFGLTQWAPPSIRHLLSHTSCLPRDYPVPYWNGELMPALNKSALFLRQLRQVCDAGSVYKYSNVNYSVLGSALERIEGDRFEMILERYVLQPLKMRATVLASIRSPNRGMAQGYGQAENCPRQPIAWQDPGMLASAVGIVSTVDDLALFAGLWMGDGTYRGKSILSSQAIGLAQLRATLNDGKNKGQVGLGWAIRDIEGMTRLRHSGLMYGFTSFIDICPKQKIGVIVLANASDVVPWYFTNQAFRMLSSAQGPSCDLALPTSKLSSESIDDADIYVGDYGFDEGHQKVIRKCGQLLLIAPGDTDAWQTPVTLVPKIKHVFTMQGGEWHGEEIRFFIGADKRAERMDIDGIYWTRESS